MRFIDIVLALVIASVLVQSVVAGISRHYSSTSATRRSSSDHYSTYSKSKSDLKSSTSTVGTPQTTIPFGPYNFSASTNQTGVFTHFIIPPAPGSYQPFLTPVLVSPGLTFSLSGTSAACAYSICISHLIQPVEDVLEWTIGLNTSVNLATNVCEGYFTQTTGGTDVQFSTMVAPGIKHFAFYAVSNSPSGGTGSCDYSFSVSGAVCPDGSFGSDCSIQPSSTSLLQSPVTGTLIADPAAALYFEVHPTTIYPNSLYVNVTSSSDNFTMFMHEGDLPSLNIFKPIRPRADMFVLSDGVTGNLVIPSPAYRIGSDQNRRYFLGVTRIGGQQVAPTVSQINLQVKSESTCPYAYHGPQCEFFVRYIMDPFDLTSTSTRAIIPGTSFQLNNAQTEIWYYFALIFENVNAAQNFSLGFQALDGQPLPHLYVRMGQIPTTSLYDMRSTTSQPTVRFYQSGRTLLHDAVWYVGINVPTYFSSWGDIGIFINSQCPGTSFTLNNDGSTSSTPCNGNGICNTVTHQCQCLDRWSGFQCLDVDTTGGLSPAARAILVVLVLIGTIFFGYGLCWWYRVGIRRRSPFAQAGYGHHLDEAPAAGGGGGGGGAGARAAGPPGMGRI